MKAQQFIKDHDLERAREVVEGAPAFPVFGYCTLTGSYIFKRKDTTAYYHNETNSWSEEYAIELILLDDLKRLVESVDRVNKRGYSKTKDHLDYLISYGSEFGHVSKEEVNELTADLKNYESIYGEGNE